MRTAAAAIAALSIAIAAVSAIAAPQADQSQQTAPAQAIRSQAQLDAWLEAHAGRSTPFDRLSPGARERFLLSLNWGQHGLTWFDRDDLAQELTQDGIRDILSLFGPETESLAASIHSSNGNTPPASDNGTSISDIERRYNLFYRVTLTVAPGLAGVRVLGDRFDASFPEVRNSEALRHVDDHDLRLLARATSLAARYSPAQQRTDALRNIFSERERRGVATTKDVRELRNALLVVHHFDEVRTLGETHRDAGLAPLPEFRDPVGSASDVPTVWRLDADDAVLTRTAIDLAPTQILVTAGCHYSQDAAEDISADPVLGPIFAAHAQWLVPAPGMESIAAARDWNRRFPDAQVAMIHDRAEWKLFPVWSMPVFHIVRDGRIIDSVTGWARNPTVSREPLIEALRRAGLTKNAGESD